jgi:hypothetical protein
MQQNDSTLGQLGVISTTWTPDLKFGGANTGITYNTRNGTLVRIPALGITFIRGYLYLTSKGSATGAASIVLPDTVQAGASRYGTLSLYGGTFTIAGHLQAYLDPNTTNLMLSKITAGGSASLTDADFANGSDLCIQGFIFT